MFLEVKKLDYSGKDIQDFLHNVRFRKNGPVDEESHFILLGLFLSALTNAGKENAYTLRIGHFERELTFVGFHNKDKEIEVFGDVTFSLGENNRHGKITIHGDCIECFIGRRMVSGEIIIDGDVIPGDREEYSFIGQGLAFGKIVIKGALGEGVFVGPVSSGGEVHIEGEGVFEMEADEFRGKVFQKGRLVYAGKD